MIYILLACSQILSKTILIPAEQHPWTHHEAQWLLACSLQPRSPRTGLHKDDTPAQDTFFDTYRLEERAQQVVPEQVKSRQWRTSLQDK